MEQSELDTVAAEEQQRDMPEENAAAVAALDDLEQEETQGQGQPSPEEQARQAEIDAARMEGARMAAGGVIGGLVFLLESQLPYVELPEEKRQELADKLAPVMAKSGGGLPEWLLPYKEELEFGMCLAGVGFGVFMQVRAHKKAERPAPTKPSPAEGVAGQAGELIPFTGDPLDPNVEE